MGSSRSEPEIEGDRIGCWCCWCCSPLAGPNATGDSVSVDARERGHKGDLFSVSKTGACTRIAAAGSRAKHTRANHSRSPSSRSIPPEELRRAGFG